VAARKEKSFRPSKKEGTVGAVYLRDIRIDGFFSLQGKRQQDAVIGCALLLSISAKHASSVRGRSFFEVAEAAVFKLQLQGLFLTSSS